MLRSRLPLIIKTFTLIFIFGLLAVLGFHFVNPKNKITKVDKPSAPGMLDGLSTENKNIEYKQFDGRTRFKLNAATDKVFSDGHHELEQVKMEFYDAAGAISSMITSERGSYDPDPEKNILRFEKNVAVDMANGLKVKTESINYNPQTKIADSTDKVEFTRDNVHGSCVGAVLDSNEEKLEMKAAVHVVIEPKKAEDDKADGKAEGKKTGDQQSSAAGPPKAAKTEQKLNKHGKPKKTAEEKRANQARRKQLGITKGSQAKSGPGASPLTQKKDQPIVITGNWGEYTGKDKVVKLRGAAKIAEPDQSLSAAALTAFLTAENKLQKVEARGQSKLVKTDAQSPSSIDADNMDFHFTPTGQIERLEARGQSKLQRSGQQSPARVDAKDMDFFFDEVGQLSKAVAVENVVAETLEVGPGRRLSANKLILFTVPGASGSQVDHIIASGNVYLRVEPMAATPANPNPTVKELQAEEAELYYQPGGTFLKEAEAHKQVLLTLTPVKRQAGAERRHMTAEHCKLLFFETGNNAREFIADGKVKFELEPYESDAAATIQQVAQTEQAKAAAPMKGKVTQTTESDHARILFDKVTGEMTDGLQEGNFKYEEGARHAVADRANYTAAKKLIELRGGKVMVWDDIARTQADEIDLFTEKQESFARGRVRSTYYNPGTIGKATPFRNMKSPVFITAKEAHSYNARGEAVYTGDARAWQDDNFVSSQRLELYRDKKSMVAIGEVSSALYRTAKTEKKDVPIFATSQRLDFSDLDRLAVYQGQVKMRQGDETLDAERVKIFLQTDSNEVKRMEAKDKVVMVQPGRRAEGDQAEYTAADQRTILTGNLARVVSEVQGTVTGRRLTLMGADDRIFADDQQGTRRVRSTHEVQR